MDAYEQIDAVITRAEQVIPQETRKQKVRLYAEGLKAKLRQTEFALFRLEKHRGETDQSRTSTARDDFLVRERVDFYCDAYWIFLYSALDVLAQVINQATRLGLTERDCSFNDVETKLKSRQLGTSLQKRCTACQKSHAFKNLRDYRNCSIHRRQIYIKEEARTIIHTAGYESDATGPAVSVERVICENPLALAPRISQGRRVPEYLVETRGKIVRAITAIVRSIEAVK